MNFPQKLNLQLQVDLEELQSLAHMVEAFGFTHSLPDRTTFIMNLGLDELITNVLAHGQFHSGVEPVVNIQLSARGNTSILVVESNDAPFDPTKDTNPDTDSDLLSRGIGGLGLHLVKEQASRVSYEYIDGKNRLILEYDSP